MAKVTHKKHIAQYFALWGPAPWTKKWSWPTESVLWPF